MRTHWTRTPASSRCLPQRVSSPMVQPGAGSSGSSCRLRARFSMATGSLMATLGPAASAVNASRRAPPPFHPRVASWPRAVADGRLPYAALNRAWREERRRTPDLPLVFRDSDVAVMELQQRGLDARRRRVLPRRGVRPWRRAALGCALGQRRVPLSVPLTRKARRRAGAAPRRSNAWISTAPAVLSLRTVRPP